MKTLNDLFTQTSGKALKKSNQNGSLHKYITTSNLFWGRFDFSEVREMYFMENELEKCTAKKGDLLVCNGGDVGRSAVWEYDYDICLQNHITRLRPKSEDVFPKFYYYAMYYIKNNELINGNGVGIASLSAKELMSIKVPHPSLPEQQKIAAHLDSIQSAIDNKKQQFQQLDELVKSKFVEMFGNPGINENNYGIVSITELSQNLDSRRKPVTAKNRTEGEFPYYGASGIVDYVGDYLFDEDILLISEDGANLIARSTPIAFSVKGKVWVNNHAHVLSFTNRETQIFVEFYFSLFDISPFVTGAAQPKLSQNKLNEIPIFNPPIELQNKFAEYVQKIDSAKAIIKNQLADLQELLDSKMDEYFS